MRNLVRRYVTVEQRKAESQGVTEDDVNEIKQDISAFRCELVEILKNSGMNTSTATGAGSGKRSLIQFNLFLSNWWQIAIGVIMRFFLTSYVFTLLELSFKLAVYYNVHIFSFFVQYTITYNHSLFFYFRLFTSHFQFSSNFNALYYIEGLGIPKMLLKLFHMLGSFCSWRKRYYRRDCFRPDIENISGQILKFCWLKICGKKSFIWLCWSRNICFWLKCL